MSKEELTEWIVNIGIDEFQTISKQVQFRRKLEKYVLSNYKGVIDDNEEEKTTYNANVVASFMEHCKENGLVIPDLLFESYFNA